MTTSGTDPVGGSTPLPSEELVGGEIPDAFSTSEWFGPVRLLFTNVRVLVVAQGSGSSVRSPLALRRWQRAPGLIRQVQVVSTPLGAEPERVVWGILNSAVTAVSVERPAGTERSAEESLVRLRAHPAGVQPGSDTWRGPLGGLLASLDRTAGAVPGLNRVPRGFEFLVRSSDTAIRAVLQTTAVARALS